MTAFQTAYQPFLIYGASIGVTVAAFPTAGTAFRIQTPTTFSDTVTFSAATTASLVVGTTAALQMPQTSLSAVTTIDSATGKISLTVRFPVVGANGNVYWLLGTVSAV